MSLRFVNKLRLLMLGLVLAPQVDDEEHPRYVLLNVEAITLGSIVGLGIACLVALLLTAGCHSWERPDWLSCLALGCWDDLHVLIRSLRS